MALQDCLKVALDAGEITRSQHDRLVGEYERFYKAHAAHVPPTALATAKQALLDQLKAETAHQKRKAKLAIDAAIRIKRNLGDNPGRNALLLLEHYGEAPFDSVAGRQKALEGEALARLGSTLLHTFRRSTIAGDKMRHNRAIADNVAREMRGEDSGDAAAKGFAAALDDTFEFLRLRFNAAGGAIGKLENWGGPQRHDPIAVRNMGKPAWKAYIAPLLDTAKMRRPLTGGPLRPGDLDDILDTSYDRIVSGGATEIEPQTRPSGSGALANQHAEHRFFVFKDADSYLQYQRDLGGGDPFVSWMEHIRFMARDIAAMEILGPNPNGTVEWMKQTVKRAAGEAEASYQRPKGLKARLQMTPKELGKRDNARLDEVWHLMRGASGEPANALAARAFGGTRNWINASILGGAALSSLSDTGTSKIARYWAGIGGSVAHDYITALTPAGRQDAIDAGLILDEALNALHQEARFVGALEGSGITAYLADRTVTLTGLNAFTQAGKHAFGLAFFREMATQAERSFDELHPALRGRFEAYGLTAADWDGIRASPKHTGGSGLVMIRPLDVADRNLRSKFLGMVQMDTEYAVPTGGYRSRSYLLGKTQPGSVSGENLRNFGMLKSFAGVYAMIHGQRIARMAMGREWGNPLAYAGALLLATTFMGGLSMQLKQVAALRDPRPMTTPEFWGAAMMQGGGIGLYGDFLFADLNRYGGGMPMAIGGPVAEKGTEFVNLTIGNAIQFANGDETKFGKELLDFARGTTPLGNMWFIRGAAERMVFDQLQYVLDPEANDAFKRSQRDWARNFGQGHWWKRGQMLPGRAPNLGNIGRERDDVTPAGREVFSLTREEGGR